MSTGRPLSDKKREPARKLDLLGKVRSGEALQATAYVLAAGRPEDRGRYLYLRPDPDLTPERRVAEVRGSETEFAEAFRAAVDSILQAWDEGSFLPRLIQAGIFHKVDKSKLPNWKNMDPETLKIIENWDPGNQYSVPYMWGTAGLTYNMEMIRERMPDAPIGSLDMVFKPELAKKYGIRGGG